MRLCKRSISQQGHNERRSEAYFLSYVELLSDARALLEGFSNNRWCQTSALSMWSQT